VVQRLTELADIVVENFRPDVKSELGIDYKKLGQINSRVVYSIAAFRLRAGPTISGRASISLDVANVHFANKGSDQAPRSDALRGAFH
jgi:crotonobetainyl-CoA:carnitine CoA-transferase CaiB-like acyl-CoA transferase